MGLDDFKSEDETASTTSSTTTKTKSRTSSSAFEEKRIEPYAAFDPIGKIRPKAIKQCIKTWNLDWVKQFSARRMDEGEVVYYTRRIYQHDDAIGLLVFTTIQSCTRTLHDGDAEDIILIMWDFKEGKPVGRHKTIKHDDNWNDELVNAIEDFQLYPEDHMLFCDECGGVLIAKRYLLDMEPELVCRENNCKQ